MFRYYDCVIYEHWTVSVSTKSSSRRIVCVRARVCVCAWHKLYSQIPLIIHICILTTLYLSGNMYFECSVSLSLSSKRGWGFDLTFKSPASLSVPLVFWCCCSLCLMSYTPLKQNMNRTYARDDWLSFLFVCLLCRLFKRKKKTILV